MTTNSKRWALGLAATTLLLGATACGSSSGDSDVAAPEDCTPAHDVTTVSEGSLTVAVAENPPVAITSGGKFDGLEPSLLKAFAEDNCLALKVEPMSFAATIPAIQSGRADLAAGGYYRTAERAKIVDLSNPIWLDQMGIIAKDEIDKVSELEGKKLGTVDGYLWVPELTELFGSDLTIYPSNVEMKADLESGRISVAIDSTSLAGGYEGYKSAPAQPDDRVQSTVQPAQVGWPFTMGNSSLESALNDAIASWHTDGTIGSALEDNGLPTELAETGEPRIIE